ncbi:MAG: ArnT family glycosyltransferase [Gemmataceae bacterium]
MSQQFAESSPSSPPSRFYTPVMATSRSLTRLWLHWRQSFDAPVTASHRWWRLLAAALILLSSIGHIVYLAHDCPLDLAPDEAHYWDWSRHLDWSYYSKGPLVAYLIRASSWLQPWTQALTGSAVLAVRLPAVLCGALLLVSLYWLTWLIYGQDRLAALVVIGALTTPLIAAASGIMTIDSPYVCCWGWALVLGYYAVFRQKPWAWPGLGLVIGVGVLAKYTMVLWLPALALFLWTTPGYRQRLRQPGFWVAAGVAAVGCLPIIIWNAQHDWITLRHLQGHAGLNQGPRWYWWGPFAYVGTQFGLWLGVWFVLWAAAVITYRPWKEPNAPLRYLWWLSVPMFVFFLLFAFKNKGGEPNWPVAAYLSGMVLAAGWLRRQWLDAGPRRRWLLAGGVTGTCVFSLVVTLMAHHSETIWPLFTRLTGPASAEQPFPMRRVDPTCRLRGWRTLAAEVDRLRTELRQQGIEPVLAGTSWTLPGELAFYCAGQPTVYSLGSILNDRRSQYDLWRPNPLADPQLFLGQTFIVVGESHPLLDFAFDYVETPRMVRHTEHGQPIAAWAIVVCRGFRGFPFNPNTLKKDQY